MISSAEHPLYCPGLWDRDTEYLAWPRVKAQCHLIFKHSILQIAISSGYHSVNNAVGEVFTAGPHKTPRSVSRHDQLRKKLRESKSVSVTADRRHNYRLASPQPGFASVLVSALFSPTVECPGRDPAPHVWHVSLYTWLMLRLYSVTQPAVCTRVALR